MKTKIDEPIKHAWWHWFFEAFKKSTFYRDGFLGDLTPDIDEHYYKCNFPNCKWTKKVTEYP